MNNYKKILFTVIAVLTITYPFVVFFSLNTFGPSLLSLVLFTILFTRVIIRGDYQKPEQYAQLILVGGLCLIAAWFNSEQLLRYYPVMMNLSFAAFFWVSLSSETTLIERFAQTFQVKVPDIARPYLRGLTKVWAGVLILNAAASYYTACCLSLKAWTFYNGFLAYLLFGGFMVLEFGYRQYHKKKYH